MGQLVQRPKTPSAGQGATAVPLLRLLARLGRRKREAMHGSVAFQAATLPLGHRGGLLVGDNRGTLVTFYTTVGFDSYAELNCM